VQRLLEGNATRVGHGKGIGDEKKGVWSLQKKRAESAMKTQKQALTERRRGGSNDKWGGRRGRITTSPPSAPGKKEEGNTVRVKDYKTTEGPDRARAFCNR